jgi:hypothetical protein
MNLVAPTAMICQFCVVDVAESYMITSLRGTLTFQLVSLTGFTILKRSFGKGLTFRHVSPYLTGYEFYRRESG